MSQNLLSVGFNLPELEAEKIRVLEIVRELYTQLQSFDGAKIAPINLTGLSQLNTATTSADNTLKKINNTLTEFDARLRGYNSVANQTAQLEGKLTALYTEEAAKNIQLKVAIEERTKVLKESAQVSNEDYNARKTASDVAIQQAKIESDAIKASKQQEIESQEQWILLLKESEGVANSVAAQQIKSEKAEEAQILASKQAEIRAGKEQVAQQEQNIREAKLEAKEVLLQSDAYKELLLARTAAQRRFTNAYISSQGVDTDELKSSRNNLEYINSTISNVDKQLEKAGSGGAAVLGRALTGAVTQLRYLAYILPGVGIAGIFNLAFEAIGNAADALGIFDDKIKKEIALEKEFSENVAKSNAVLKDQSDLISGLSTSSIAYFNNQKKLAEAAGQNFESQIDDINKFNQQKKEQADATVSTLGASYNEISQLNTKLDELTIQRKKTLDGLSKVDVEIKTVTDTNISPLGLGQVITSTLAKTGKLSGLNETKDNLKAQLDAFDTAFNTAKTRRDQIKEALTNLTSADAENKAELLKEQKFFADEYRRIELDRVTQEVSLIKQKNQLILSSETSSEQQRISALNNISQAEIKLANAQRANVLNNVSSSSADKTIANNDADKAISQSVIDRNEKIRQTELQFYQKEKESQNKQALDEISIEASKNEDLYNNDKGSYSDRLQGLLDYIEDRKKFIYTQYNFELDIARKTTPKDLLPQKELELATNRDKEIIQLENSTGEKLTTVIDSWYKRQLKVISDNDESEVTKTQESETKQLSLLNESYEKRILSYRRFSIKKKELEQKFLESTDLSQIKDDQSQLDELLSLRADVTSKILQAEQKITNATNPEEHKNATDEFNGLVESSKDIDKKISDNHKKTADDNLKYQEDKNKLEADGRRQLNANLIELEREFFDDIKEVVDASIEYRIQKIQLLQEAYDRQVDQEKESIDRSTLNNKDKNAYEIQLNAQKEASDKNAAKEERKLKHDEAVFNRDADIAQIILNTEVAITQALRIPVVGEALAFTYAALGATALATALAVKIPSFAKGVEGFEGGYARFGEDGTELVKEPNRPAYYAFSETIKYLPKGTDIIPMYDSPSLSTKVYEKKDNSWEQTKYLGRIIKSNNKQTINNIVIDIGYQMYKYKIIHGDG